MSNNKGKRPMGSSNNSNVENITNEVEALAARRGITRNAAARILASQPGPSRRHAAAWRAQQRVFDNPDMAGEIAKHLASDTDLARFGGVTKATRDAARRELQNQQIRNAAMPLYKNVKKPMISKHTRMYPYNLARAKQAVKWPYQVHGHLGKFCSAMPQPPAAKYPTKAKLVKRMERLHLRKRSGMLRLVHYAIVRRNLMLAVNGMHFECGDTHERLQRELKDLVHWMTYTFQENFVDGDRGNDPDQVMAANVQRFARRIAEMSYHAMYIVMLLWGVFR